MNTPEQAKALRVKRAGKNLQDHFIRTARRVQRTYGFGYVPSLTAPSCLEGIRAEVDMARKCGSFRVSAENSENTIYPSAEGNHAFRFVHDMGHWRFGLRTTFQDEMTLASIIETGVIGVFGKGSDEHRVYMADTAGQSLYHEVNGKFPDNQFEFVLDFVDLVQHAR